MSDPTYRDVAEWLPTNIGEAIEAGTPCPINGAHEWRRGSRVEIHVASQIEPVAVIEHWTCDCGMARTTDPEAGK